MFRRNISKEQPYKILKDTREAVNQPESSMILVIPSQRETMPRRKRDTSTADFAPSKMAFVNASSLPFRKEKRTLANISKIQTVFIEG